MRLVVFSDSHGRTLEMHEAIERECPDAVVHLGDCYPDACELRYAYPAIPIYAVRGNNDWANEVPWQSVISLDNVQIYLTHGHQDGVSFSSPGHVPQRAIQRNCRLALFGHTHIAYKKTIGGVFVVNPGSISLPRQGRASYAVIQITNGQVEDVQFKDTDGVPCHITKDEKQKRMGWF